MQQARQATQARTGARGPAPGALVPRQPAQQHRRRLPLASVAQRGQQPARTFKSDASIPLAPPVSQRSLSHLLEQAGQARQQQQQQQDGAGAASSRRLEVPPDSPLGRYLAWWAALPSRYKIVLAGSLSFVICNMVRARACARTTAAAA